MVPGATLCKGLNRGLGTLLAGLLAFIVGYIANASGRVSQAIIIGAAVFFIGAQLQLYEKSSLKIEAPDQKGCL